MDAATLDPSVPMADDWLAGSDDEAAEAEEGARARAQLQERFAAIGFQQGASVGHDAAIQAGFDDGFRDGQRVGLAHGHVLGALMCAAPARRGRARSRCRAPHARARASPTLSSQRASRCVRRRRRVRRS